MESTTDVARARTGWFAASRWGVLSHYLADGAPATEPVRLTADEWNARVDDFDVAGLAAQLHEAGAGYYAITVGQNAGFYIAPNAAYDRYVGIRPSRCARRDLVADLAGALSARGIRLLVYCPNQAPENAPAARTGLGWDDPDPRKATGQRGWNEVLAEWSRRWGTAVSGWWIDGAYDPTIYERPDEPNWASLAAALRAGNPGSILAFNPGVRLPRPVAQAGAGGDYTAGEVDFALPVAGHRQGGVPILPGPSIDGAQFHILTFLGEWWGSGEPRFPKELVAGYTRHVNAHGDVLTWDVPIARSGLLPQPFIDQPTALR